MALRQIADRLDACELVGDWQVEMTANGLWRLEIAGLRRIQGGDIGQSHVRIDFEAPS